MLEEIKKDIEQDEKIYLTIAGYDGNIRASKENLILINNNVIKLKTNDGIICVPKESILYYEV